jgi:hypothetical protein
MIISPGYEFAASILVCSGLKSRTGGAIPGSDYGREFFEQARKGVRKGDTIMPRGEPSKPCGLGLKSEHTAQSGRRHNVCERALKKAYLPYLRVT